MCRRHGLPAIPEPCDCSSLEPDGRARGTKDQAKTGGITIATSFGSSGCSGMSFMFANIMAPPYEHRETDCGMDVLPDEVSACAVARRRRECPANGEMASLVHRILRAIFRGTNYEFPVARLRAGTTLSNTGYAVVRRAIGIGTVRAMAVFYRREVFRLGSALSRRAGQSVEVGSLWRCR
jgi:hypothetical protein